MSKKTVLALATSLMACGAAAQSKILNESATITDKGVVINAQLVYGKAKPIEVDENTLTTSDVASAQTQSPKFSLKPNKVKHTHFIYSDESYIDALNRWLKRANYNNVAWSLNDEAKEVLQGSPDGTLSFAHSVKQIIPMLAKQLETPLYFSERGGLAAIHQWQNREVKISLANGVSIKEATENLVHSYGWNWGDDLSHGRSWLATNNYEFGTPYPIVTPKDDLAGALNVLLQDYPVSAKLLNSTQKVFIVEEK